MDSAGEATDQRSGAMAASQAYGWLRQPSEYWRDANTGEMQEGRLCKVGEAADDVEKGERGVDAKESDA